ncbi:uncharacterized protein LOC110712718 [Chenopodium quinoa]|uniref:uncharacterized protein LOC110712718 n=1 Tax=Chenopodium quinoa TaxID=63459 RepID=UPI000B77FC78|nr:uncharacterized protein LOC110712718 [Chenopodium quinoa]
MSNVRTFLAGALVKEWEVHQMDVHNAFLHEELEEEIYMKVPPGFLRNNLDKRKYALDIISETGLLGAKAADFPMERNHKLAVSGGKKFADVEKYRRLVGRLIYLVVTRLDLENSVHILSQFMRSSKKEHCEAALRVVRYLKKCPSQGILIRFDRALQLEGWCDSDWAGFPLTRHSLTGWFVLLGLSPLSWKTKKQPTGGYLFVESRI